MQTEYKIVVYILIVAAAYYIGKKQATDEIRLNLEWKVNEWEQKKERKEKKNAEKELRKVKK